MADWRTVGHLLCGRAQAHPDRIFVRFHPSSGDCDLTYGDAWRQACRWADLFESLGVRKGPALLSLPNGPDFVGAFFGASLAGFVPAPTIPQRAMRDDEYREFLASRVHSAAGVVVVGTADQEGWDEPGATPFVTSAQLRETAEDRAPYVEGHDLGLLQFTSGTSGRARGVPLRHDALLFQASSIARALEVVPTDVGVSWLPLFHDMGLFGFLLTPAFAGASVVLLRTEAFASRPRIWMETISRQRGTITSGPPSGYVLAARCARAPLDLTSLRAAVVGAERILPSALRTVHDGLSPLGLAWSALMPAYGMAEVGAAATMTPLNRGPLCETIDVRRLQEDSEAVPVDGDGYGVVGCGVPVQSTEIRILDEAGCPLPDRRIGQIAIKSPSQAISHVQDGAMHPVSQHRGWLATGDQGYMAGGEVFVTGRIGELLVVAGEKYFPEEFEEVAALVQGVRAGRVVAVGHADANSGAERVTLLVESVVNDGGSRQQLTLAVRQALSRRSLPVCDVILVPPRTIQRTPTGKLPRARYRERLLAGQFDDV
jgi:acyl-CoA synthetase (AMP-forming)/AMP-acid ligase II